MGVPVQVSFTGTAIKQLYRSLLVCTGKNAQLYSGGPTLPLLQVSLQSDHSKCTIWNVSGGSSCV